MDSIPKGEPPNPEPATPNPKATEPSTVDAGADANTTAATTDGIIQEPSHPPISTDVQVTFKIDPDQEQTINSDTLHALVEQLRPPPSPAQNPEIISEYKDHIDSVSEPSPAQSLEQIVIIRTVDNAEHNPPQQ